MDINLVFMSKIFIFTSSVDNLLLLIVKILERVADLFDIMSHNLKS
jgi:hypothetical protein